MVWDRRGYTDIVVWDGGYTDIVIWDRRVY